MNTEHTIENPILIRYDDGEPLIDNMVAILLLNEIIFISSGNRNNSNNFLVLCNDTFAWACSDCEDISLEEIPELFAYWEQHSSYGPDVWCIKKRKLMPQKPVYDLIQKHSPWNLDEMELEENPTWNL